jgi:nitrile hydratase
MMPFAVGQRVRTKAQRQAGHTRLPGYLEKQRGTIVRALGRFAFADERASAPESARSSELYTVCFEASNVWPDAQWSGSICADLFEEYLEAEA